GDVEEDLEVKMDIGGGDGGELVKTTYARPGFCFFLLIFVN
ncbi:hypothetical protein L195_g061400, partial [Trifolium pratense]